MYLEKRTKHGMTVLMELTNLWKNNNILILQPQNDPWSVPTTSTTSPPVDPWTPVPPQRPSESLLRQRAFYTITCLLNSYIYILFACSYVFDDFR